jgi:hypothetical protein
VRVLLNWGYTKSDASGNKDIDGVLRPESFAITDKNIGNYRFGSIRRNIPISRIEKNSVGFGAGQYDVLTNYCQHYCTLIRGSD